MKFRDDIDPSNTWVVADNHWGHQNIADFCFRPLDHDQVMIAEWRAAVPADATVLHLGDLCYRGNGYFKHIIAKELTGATKLLIKGNHDKKGIGFYRDCGFKLAWPFQIGVSPLADSGLYVGGDQSQWIVSFSHYPWNTRLEGPMPENHIRVHGHIHNNGYSRDAYVPLRRNHINLSVEVMKYRPVSLQVLLDAYLLGVYPETTDEQLAEARERKARNKEATES